jgi:hypothetical protein
MSASSESVSSKAVVLRVKRRRSQDALKSIELIGKELSKRQKVRVLTDAFDSKTSLNSSSSSFASGSSSSSKPTWATLQSSSSSSSSASNAAPQRSHLKRRRFQLVGSVAADKSTTTSTSALLGDDAASAKRKKTSEVSDRQSSDAKIEAKSESALSRLQEGYGDNCTMGEYIRAMLADTDASAAEDSAKRVQGEGDAADDDDDEYVYDVYCLDGAQDMRADVASLTSVATLDYKQLVHTEDGLALLTSDDESQEEGEDVNFEGHEVDYGDDEEGSGEGARDSDDEIAYGMNVRMLTAKYDDPMGNEEDDEEGDAGELEDLKYMLRMDRDLSSHDDLEGWM